LSLIRMGWHGHNKNKAQHTNLSQLPLDHETVMAWLTIVR
jgi:hypothetical protein